MPMRGRWRARRRSGPQRSGPGSTGARRCRSWRRPPTGPAIPLMFVHDPHRLHEGITDGRADETEAFFLQILTHGVAMHRRLRDIAQVERPPTQHLAVGKLPDVVDESARLLAYLEVCLRVADESIDFEPVPDDARIQQQAFALELAVPSHFCRVEMIECRAIALALAQNGEPAQARLRTLET